MNEIRTTQSASAQESSVQGSTDNAAQSVPPLLEDIQIVEKVLGTRRGH